MLIVLVILSVVSLFAALVMVLFDGNDDPMRKTRDVEDNLLEDGADSGRDVSDYEEYPPAVWERSIGFSDIKRMVKHGRIREFMPILLAVGGFLGLLLFGSLALFVGLENKVIGGLIAAVSIFTVSRILYRMIMALLL